MSAIGLGSLEGSQTNWVAGALEGSLLPESAGQTGRRTSQELTAPPLVGEEGVRGFKPQALQKLFYP